MPPTARIARRTLLLGALAAGLGAGAVRAQQPVPPILVVSHKSVLNDTRHARALLQAENELTVKLQAKVDAIKAKLEAEEKELAELRGTLKQDEFETRVAEFDRKVRSQRREMLRQGNALSSVFRAQRLKLVDALGPILAEVRAAHGASAILNADDLLDFDPALDVTAEVIALFNAKVPDPEIPDLADIERAANPAPGLR